MILVTDLAKPLAWAGSVAGVAGAAMLALNLSWSGWGFAVFAVNSLSWLAVAWLRGDRPLLILNAAFCITNAVGIVRWLT